MIPKVYSAVIPRAYSAVISIVNSAVIPSVYKCTSAVYSAVNPTV